jgi:hypothetical protein
MKRFARMAMAILGLGALGFALSLVPQRSASGTPAAANVNIINTSVPVGNPAGPSGPVPLVTQPAQDLNGFAAPESVCNFASGGFACSLNPFFTPPSGEIAVIEFVSSHCSVAPGTQATLFISYGSASVVIPAEGTITLPFNSSESVNFGNFTAIATARAVRAYAANTPMQAQWDTNTGQFPGAFCTIDMTGHFTAAP